MENTLKFSVAPSVLASITLKLSLKRRKVAKLFVRAFGEPKNRSLLSVHAVLPPSGKIPAGAHGGKVTYGTCSCSAIGFKDCMYAKH